MYLTACQVPDEPCVDGTEKQVAAVSQFFCFGYILQDPSDFCAGEISIDEEACFFSDLFCPACFFQGVAVRGSSSALPDDGIMYGSAVAFVPQDGCFSLVCDTDSGDIFSGDMQFFDCRTGNFQLCVPDFHGVMFYPAAFGIILFEFLLGSAQHFAVFVE